MSIRSKKHPQQSAVRCPSCNELLTIKDAQNLKRNRGVCGWCAGWLHYYNGGRPYVERLDFDDWLARLWLDDTSLRPAVVNNTSDFWWNE